MTELNVDIHNREDSYRMVFNSGEYEIVMSPESYNLFVSAVERMAESKPGAYQAFSFGLYDDDGDDGDEYDDEYTDDEEGD